MLRYAPLILSFVSLLSYANQDNIITLSAQKNISENTLVTMGIPFSDGQLSSIDSFAVFDENGKEIPVYVKPTLSWHFSQANPKSIRSIKVQFFVNSINEDNNEYSFRYDYSPTLNRLPEYSISDGLMTNLNPNKNSVSHPIVIASLEPTYLADSGIIPAFYPMRNDTQKQYWDQQFSWAKELEFNYSNTNDNKSLLANWLFDRPTSLYKGCMRTASPECYVEAFSSYSFWMNSLKKDGTMLEGKGGSLIDYQINDAKQKDSKYVYIEPIKIHLALTGDDRFYDNNLILDMANLSSNNHHYQPKTDIYYQSESASFTERAAGLSLLAQVSAYELTGNQKLLDNIQKRIDVLYNHQLNNPDGLPSDGTWRHSFSKHEGTQYPGDRVDHDRRFSPWMTENIIDALWQSYHVTNDQRIPEMIRYAGEGLLKWGFMSGQGYMDKYNKTPLSVINKTYTLGCNTTKVSPMYFGSSVAPIGEAVITETTSTQDYYTGSENSLLYKYNWYTDSHLPELILNLSLALHFETDQEKANALIEKIKLIEDGFLNEACGSVNSTERMFNWNNRSNYWGTYLWVMNELDQLPDLNNPDNKDSDDFKLDEIYENSFEQNFSNELSHYWSNSNAWQLLNGSLTPLNTGKIILNPDFNIGNNYKISATFNTDSESLKTGLIFNGIEDSHYSVKFKTGPYGGVYLKYHTDSWDTNGSLIAKSISGITLNGNDTLYVAVKNNIAYIGLNDKQYLSYEIPVSSSNSYTGMIAISSFPEYSLDSFKIEYNVDQLTDKFDGNSIIPWPKNDNWLINNNKLESHKSGHYTFENDKSGNNYSISSDISHPNSSLNLLGIIFATDSDGNYYSARVKIGTYGRLFIYKHNKTYGSGELIYSKSTIISKDKKSNLSLSVKENKVKMFIDNILITEYLFDIDITSSNIGFINITGSDNLSVDNFKYTVN